MYVDVTSGTVYQLHKQSFPAQDMPTDDIHIVNHSTDPYLTVNDLGGQILDADGDSLSYLWSAPQAKRSSSETLLFQGFRLRQPHLCSFITDAVEFKAEFGIIGTDQKVIDVAFFEGDRHGWFGNPQ